ncbi:uncharacterized protein LY89DRAFT_788489 [Mollisia scopiformis]|uniref:Uncharacterized protein n=1 Tax=Mollisia scopiformis TaxID=149040 RepID=A0A132BA09_MOLSC|nr:uncharacterized protein LY89DRAFT_788489 [Mollisia scopiformis]KUJ09083.1 hypothetical protein LY89DRAFT_788489 [Mollisia scopiformis]
MSSAFFTESTAANGVHLVSWTNWSYGSIRGATLTISRRDGGLLIAFLALFVTVTGGATFRTVSYGLHQLLSSNIQQDGLYHQRQAILRNSGMGLRGVWKLICMQFAWRGKAKSIAIRVIPLLTQGLLNIGAFYVASVFSSQISTSTGSEVLLSSPQCGYINPGLDDSFTDQFSGLLPYYVQLAVASTDYAQQCYQINVTAQDCSTFSKHSLPYHKSTGVACPFNQSICLQASDAIQFDTGPLDSHVDLGINAPQEDRFTYRSVLTCSPLKTQGYTSLQNGSDGSVESQVMNYYYGTSGTEDLSVPNPYTYFYPNYLDLNITTQSQNTQDYTNRDLLPRLVEQFCAPGNTDPASFYYRDQPVGALGCTQQFQFCNPNLSDGTGCTPLLGFYSNFANPNVTNGLWKTAAQDTSFTYFTSVIGVFGFASTNIDDVVASLGISALLARNSLGVGIQGPLPNNQWELEVEHWMQASLSLLQRTLLEQAAGPFTEDVYPWLAKPQDAQDQAQCRRQMIRSTDYTSFSILGLTLLFALGGIIIILSLILEPLVNCIQGRRGINLYKRMEWATNETLQLQRLAHEEIGFGNWTETTSTVPVTKIGDLLAIMDVSDQDHPRLGRPILPEAETEKESKATAVHDEGVKVTPAITAASHGKAERTEGTTAIEHHEEDQMASAATVVGPDTLEGTHSTAASHDHKIGSIPVTIHDQGSAMKPRNAEEQTSTNSGSILEEEATQN